MTTSNSVSWGAPVVSVIVLLTFGAVLALALLHGAPSGSETILNVLLGTLGTLASGVVNFWVGSSAGSARKTELLADSVPSALLPQPAALVPAADVAK